MYHPEPIDTTMVILPDDLKILTEKLAQNTHDVWATGRISEGWTYAPGERNEKTKTTPLLVPYEQLPESEKDYDRRTSLETLKVIIQLGYSITRDFTN